MNPLLKTAVLFSPTNVRSNERMVDSISCFFEWASELALVSGETVGVTMQHSLRHDEFALMVECGQKTFASHKSKPKAVFDDVSKQLFKQVERLNESVQTKKRSAGAKSRKRYRR